MDWAVYSEWAILRFFRKAKLGRISVARKQQGQSLALWRALVTDNPSFLPPHRGRRVRTYGRVAGGGPARRKSRRCSACAPMGAGQVDPSADGCQPRHAAVLFDDRLPETAGAFGEIAEFFDKHLGK